MSRVDWSGEYGWGEGHSWYWSIDQRRIIGGPDSPKSIYLDGVYYRILAGTYRFEQEKVAAMKRSITFETFRQEGGVKPCAYEFELFLDEKKEKRISASYLKAGPVDFLRVDGKIVKVYITRLGPVRHIDKQGKLFVAPIRLEEC